MTERFKKMVLFSAFSLLIICPATSYGDGYWDYHGSGRDHPYSDYIDRYYYIGYADYSPVVPDYADWHAYINNRAPLAITPVSEQLVTPIPAPPAGQPDEFTVNIPNDHGGYTAIVIKRSGNGYTGPQGEFYPQFPTVAQLKVIYGK